MGTATRLSARRLGGMLVVWLVAALIPGALFGGEAAHTSPGTPATPADVVLTVQDGVLSLRAQDASLKGIFDAIGRQLPIEVETRIPADERITLAFDQLSLAEALKRFRPYVNYLALEDAAKAPGTIRTLIVVSKRAAGVPSRPTTQDGEALAPPAPSQSEAPDTSSPRTTQPFTLRVRPHRRRGARAMRARDASWGGEVKQPQHACVCPSSGWRCGWGYGSVGCRSAGGCTACRTSCNTSPRRGGHVPRRGPLEMDQAVRIVRRICRLRCFRGPLFPQACLRQALALYHLLSRLGYPVAIHFGVYKAGEALRGHSWVTVDGKPVAERLPPEALQTIYAFPAAVSHASQERSRAGRRS